EIELVGIFQQLLRESGLWGGQGALEVGERLALAAVQPALDLVDQHRAAPPILNRLAGIPFTLGWLLHLIEQHAIVEPGQFPSKLLENSLIRIGRGKGAHILQVAQREPLHVWEGTTEVPR